MTTKTRKPWRVIASGSDAIDTTDHLTEGEARDTARASLAGDMEMAKVFQWKGRRWWLVETFSAGDTEDQP
ncbi:hypothetical protein M2164_005924 [Streptomyces sp. SAI-208]|uniref:hypothetical protein n=1 Tax=Streptomyces sp. SAI-208 TaxID=2940550 RepID=UPI00247715E1|nr:hypothetical protein [Streptomyces sp. SAI-208]MDH6610289.1 hypothetical protein [Streptomyces sp. SAI-208]